MLLMYKLIRFFFVDKGFEISNLELISDTGRIIELKELINKIELSALPGCYDAILNGVLFLVNTERE